MQSRVLIAFTAPHSVWLCPKQSPDVGRVGDACQPSRFHNGQPGFLPLSPHPKVACVRGHAPHSFPALSAPCWSSAHSPRPRQAADPGPTTCSTGERAHAFISLSCAQKLTLLLAGPPSGILRSCTRTQTGRRKLAQTSIASGRVEDEVRRSFCLLTLAEPGQETLTRSREDHQIRDTRPT